jgi:hypothetical protein
MTPQEKAKKLTDKYFKGSDLLYHDLSWIQAKECALIAVDEMLDYRNALFINEGSLAHQYLLQVKEEINKL